MPTLVDQIQKFSHDYVRQGGKRNRRQQVARIRIFLQWVQQHDHVNSLGQLGRRHVIEFWKANRAWADGTLYGYWRAICVLWLWLGRNDVPPKPRYKKDES